ncbi:MAG: tyrosine decarboxylase MfnA [Candidatus Bathyarchaeota archaeon]|nr:tyrosine decarboxylase MfnA [Candidatus Bathyarchaeota archaeon]
MQQKGSNARNVLAALKRFHNKDQAYRSGRILCAMCTQPHPIAKKAYQMFLDSNLGDIALFAGSAQIEKEAIADLSKLLHSPSTAGFIVSGGTEANLMALLAAKNTHQTSEPEVVLPESAHFSFTKICKILSLRPIYAELREDFTVDPDSVEQLVTKQTVAIVGTVGTSELGVVDPIEALSKIAAEREIWLHVDAAFGGLVLPFMDHPKHFDFLLEAVQSMTVDPHKMGMAAIPAGGILFRKPDQLEALKTETPYLSNKGQYTFVGTRSGASAASVWAVFRALGTDGYRKIVADCMDNTSYLTEGLKKAGFKLVIEPALNVVTFRSDNSKELAEKLWHTGWYVSYVPRYDCIRVVVMPHVKRRHIAAFLETLKG